MHSQEIAWLEHCGRRLAVRTRAGSQPTLLFLPGYMSDMEGAKAQALDAFAAERSIGCVRFDYSGTGSSDGRIEDGTLDRWLDDALAILDRLTEGPVILVGSSMGGWLSLHIALRRPERVRAIVGIAAAPDFTEWGFGPAERKRLQTHGALEERLPDGSRGRFVTRGFWSSGQTMLLLSEELPIHCPVHLVHGDLDNVVPVAVAHRLMAQLRSDDVQLTIVKGGDHRLSEPREIAAILTAANRFLDRDR